MKLPPLLFFFGRYKKAVFVNKISQRGILQMEIQKTEYKKPSADCRGLKISEFKCCA